MQHLYHEKCTELKVKPDRRVMKKEQIAPITRRRGYSLSAKPLPEVLREEEEEDNIRTDISNVSSSSLTTTTTSNTTSSSSSNRQIRKLSFKKLGLHDTQIQAIAHMLSWHHLMDWNLVTFSKNLISDAVVPSLITLVSYLPSVTTFDLSYNKITEVGARNLQKGILSHSNNCKLLLHHNEMKQDVHFSNSIVTKFMQQYNTTQHQPLNEEFDDTLTSSTVATSAMNSTASSGNNTPNRLQEFSPKLNTPKDNYNTSNAIFAMNTSGDTSTLGQMESSSSQQVFPEEQEKIMLQFEASPILKQEETLTASQLEVSNQSKMIKNPFDSPLNIEKMHEATPSVEQETIQIPPHIAEQMNEKLTNSIVQYRNIARESSSPVSAVSMDPTSTEFYSIKRSKYLQKDSKLKEFVTYTVDPSLKYNLHQQGIQILNCNAFLNITYLDVSCNNISSIECIPTNVVYVDLSHNILTDVMCFENAKQLRVLLLKDNMIQKISGLEQCTALEVLDLSGNQISRVINLENLINLKLLDLSYNQIRNKGTLRLLSLNKCLESLFLHGNPITFALDKAQRRHLVGLTKVYVKNLVPSLLYYDGNSVTYSIRKKDKIAISVQPKDRFNPPSSNTTNNKKQQQMNSTTNTVNSSSSISEIASPRKLKRQIEESVALSQILFDTPETSSRALVYGSKSYWEAYTSTTNTSTLSNTNSKSNHTPFQFIIYTNMLTLIRDFVKTIEVSNVENETKEWDAKWPVIDQALQELDELQPHIVDFIRGDNTAFILQTFHNEMKNCIYLMKSVRFVFKQETEFSEALSTQSIKQRCEECNVFDNTSLWEIVPHNPNKDLLYALDIISLCCNSCKQKLQELLLKF